MALLPSQSGRGFIIAGHSHLFTMGMDQGYDGPAILKPAQNWGADGFFLLDSWRGGRPGEYWDRLIAEANGREIVLSYAGNQHHSDFLFMHGGTFDFVWSDQEPNVLADSDVIPKRAVKAYIDWTLRDLRMLVPALYEAGARHVLLLGSPGQRQDVQSYAQKLLDTEFARDFAGRQGVNIEDMSVRPASVLQKLWRVMQESQACLATDTHATFVAVPEVSLTEDGFLAPDMNGNDLSHANFKFGQMMADKAVNAIMEMRAR